MVDQKCFSNKLRDVEYMWKISLLLLIVILLSACNKQDPVLMPKESATGQVTQKESTKPTESSKPSSTKSESSIIPSNQSTNLALDKFKEQGYQVEEKQIFTRKFEGIGELTVTPVTKFGNNEDFPLSLILSGGTKEIILTPSRKDGHAMFSSFEAIAFKDIDGDSLKSGYTDIIVIANFITGAGQDGAKPFSDVFIFKNDTWGGFEEDTILENRIISSANSRTITMKNVFDLAKPL